MLNAIECKMRLKSVTTDTADDGSVIRENLTLVAVKGPDNFDWARSATPEAEFTITIGNSRSMGLLSTGAIFKINFTEVVA